MFYRWQSNFMQLPPDPKNESTISDLLNLYLDDNPETGYLIFQVAQNSETKGLIPIPNAKITISKPMGNSYFISKVIETDIDGKTKPIALPTVPSYRSQTPEDSRLYSTYNATVEATNYLTTDVYDIRVFDDITSLQTVLLIPQEGYNVRQIYHAEPQNLCDRWY